MEKGSEMDEKGDGEGLGGKWASLGQRGRGVRVNPNTNPSLSSLPFPLSNHPLSIYPVPSTTSRSTDSVIFACFSVVLQVFSRHIGITDRDN